MLVEQVEDVGPEPLERCLRHLSDVLRPAVHSAAIQFETKFGGDHHLVTKGSQGLAHELFICERTVHFRGIEKGNAAFDGRAEQCDHRLPVSRWTIRSAHSHAAQPDRRDFQITISKFAFLHFLNSSFDWQKLYHEGHKVKNKCNFKGFSLRDLCVFCVTKGLPAQNGKTTITKL